MDASVRESVNDSFIVGEWVGDVVGNPVFWLGLSLFLVAVSLTVLVTAAVPVMIEVSRTARSADRLFETLARELPPTLEALRLTSRELGDLAEVVDEGVKSAGQVAKRVDQTLGQAQEQVRTVQITTRSTLAGLNAAWKTLIRPAPKTAPPSPPVSSEAGFSEASGSDTGEGDRPEPTSPPTSPSSPPSPESSKAAVKT